MIDLLTLVTGFVLAILSLLIGYQLGRNQSLVTPGVSKQIQQIFRRVVPNPEVGAVERPTQAQNFYRDNPRVAAEHKLMADEFEKLNK